MDRAQADWQLVRYEEAEHGVTHEHAVAGAHNASARLGARRTPGLRDTQSSAPKPILLR
jgi:hypothetical protein